MKTLYSNPFLNLQKFNRHFGNSLPSVLAVCGAVALFSQGSEAANITWDGGTSVAGVGGNGTEWGTAANWRPDTAPVDGDSISFNAANLQSNNTAVTTLDSNVVTLGNQNTSTVQVGQIIGGTGIPAGSYITSIVNSSTVTISQNATATASNVTVTVSNTGGLASGQTISLGTSRTIDTLFQNAQGNNFTIGSAADITAGNALTITNSNRNNFTGSTLTIAANVVLAPNATGKSTWVSDGGSNNGSITVTGAVSTPGTVILNKGGAAGTVAFNGINTFAGSVVVDAGTLSLGGTNAYTGTSTASGGTLQVNFNAGSAAPLTNIINSSSSLVLGGVRGGGTLIANGKNLANVVNSQTFNGTTLNAGASTLNIVNGINSGKTLVNLGAITPTRGGTVNFVQPTVATAISAQNGYATSTANDASGILGAYATVGGTDWASNNGTNIVAYTGYVDQVGNVMAAAATTNLRITSGTSGNITQGAGTTTVNTLRVNDAAARTVTVGTGNTLRVNGILATGTAGLTLGEAANAGTLTAGLVDNTSAELIVNNSTAVTVNSVLANNGTGAVALTKSGSGTLTLATPATYTGGTTVNGGTLAVTASSTNPFADTGAITITGGTLSLGAGTNQTTTGAVILASGTLSGGTLTKSGANYDVRNGSISTKLAGSVGLDKTTTGTVTLSNTVANTFTGDTTITEGSLVGSSAANVVSINGNLIVGSVGGGNPASYSNSGSNLNFNSAKNVTIYSNGTVGFGGGAQNLNGTINVIGGSLTGSQIYQNTTINMTGGSFAGNAYGTINSYATNASANTAVISAWLQAAASKNFTVADGAAATDLLLSGGLATNTAAIVKGGAGKMVISSTGNANTGSTTINGGILSVAKLADGAASSSIGASAATAGNLRLGNGTTLQYIGAGNDTNRLFTINGTAAGDSATLDASGTGAVNFTGTGSLAYGTTAQTRTLILAGSSAANNSLAAVIGNNGTGGVVSVTKNDAGKWILNGTNSYSGATTISGGTLALGAAGSIANSPRIIVGNAGSSGAVLDVSAKTSGFTIGSAQTLSGIGTLDANDGVSKYNVTIEGVHAPGNSPGTQTVDGNLSYANGSIFEWDLAANNDTDGLDNLIGATADNGVTGTDYDSVTVTGNLNISSSAIFKVMKNSGVDFTAAFWDSNQTWSNIFNVGGTTTSGWSDTAVAVYDGSTPQDISDYGSFTISGSTLSWTAVPEPSSALAGILLAAGLLRRRRTQVS